MELCVSVCFSANCLFGMGNPLLDIVSVVDKDLLDKWVTELDSQLLKALGNEACKGKMLNAK